MKRVRETFCCNDPATYQIKVGGRLDESWSSWFSDLTITYETGSDATPITTLTGPVADQSALHGLLAKIRDLGLLLISVQLMDKNE